MSHDPYAPPKSVVRDVAAAEPARWYRAWWVHLPVFIGLIVVLWQGAQLVPGLSPAAVLAGTVLGALLCYFPACALRRLSDQAPPWWWDVLYYVTFVGLLLGLVVEDTNLIAAGVMPTVLLNGITAVLAIDIEMRRGIRVYVSGRRFVFSPGA